MLNLFKLAAWMLVESNRASDARSATLRIMGGVLCFALAGIALLGAVGCAATALWILALPNLGPIGAAVIVAAALAALALILTAFGLRIVSLRSRKRDRAALPPLLLDEATRLFTEHKGAVLLAALLTGIVVANAGRRS